MHTDPILRERSDRRAYHQYLQSDHDFRIRADVLTLEEKHVGGLDVLDGQVNLQRTQPNRTATLTLSDPEGALSFGTSFARDDKHVLWVNRLVRIRHEVTVPGLGDVEATCMVGVPTAVGRNGGEVSLELGDKSLLADHGVRPRTYKKGQNVRAVLVSLLSDLTGERHFRIPPTKRVLSRPYTVGMGDNALTPWAAFRRIAAKEAHWRAFYSCDGYATCVPARDARASIDVADLLALPNASATFTEFINYAKVTSRREPPNKKPKKGAKDKKESNIRLIIHSGVAVLPPSHDLSMQSLNRNGVPRLLPLVVEDDDLRTQRDVNDRVRDELQHGSDIDYQQAYETMPFFHLDHGDYLDLPMGIGKVAFMEGSIPLGTGGNMTVGARKWVSRPIRVKRVRSQTTVKRRKHKGGKQDDGGTKGEAMIGHG